EQVLGVSAVGPGYATWSIKPHPGNLDWAQGVVPTRYGDIAARWSSARHLFTLHVQTPTGTDGTIAVPATPRSLVIVNGRPVFDHGRRGAFPSRYADGYVQITVPGGRYDVTVIES
ncbi:MAG TPA: alpha-L-rhamnosidase C-terminal domain-containing protein, partial [Pseudonocardiaceae bacterium]